MVSYSMVEHGAMVQNFIVQSSQFWFPVLLLGSSFNPQVGLPSGSAQVCESQEHHEN